MAITDIFRVNKIKTELDQAQKERDALRTTLSSTEHMTYYDLTKAIAELNERKEAAQCALGELESSIEKKKQALQQQLADLDQQANSKRAELNKEFEEKRKELVLREQNTRAGYVYIISNVGSFGEHIYKIGVTRRLDPQERVDELGDASVPFDFDIHALIFSDDAPSLERALHRAFESQRLNMINRRREFFNVTLEEIKQVVTTNFSKPVEFIELADAPEYRQSHALKQNGAPVKPEQVRPSLFSIK